MMALIALRVTFAQFRLRMWRPLRSEMQNGFESGQFGVKAERRRLRIFFRRIGPEFGEDFQSDQC